MQEKYIWKNLNFTCSDNEIDYQVIINKPDNQYYDLKKLLFSDGPWCYDDNQYWGVKTWGEWADLDPNKFVPVRTHIRYLK